MALWARRLNTLGPDFYIIKWESDMEHPRVSRCSCHLSSPSLLTADGQKTLRPGDWVLENEKTGEVYHATDEEMSRDFLVVDY